MPIYLRTARPDLSVKLLDLAPISTAGCTRQGWLCPKLCQHFPVWCEEKIVSLWWSQRWGLVVLRVRCCPEELRGGRTGWGLAQSPLTAPQGWAGQRCWLAYLYFIIPVTSFTRAVSLLYGRP